MSPKAKRNQVQDAARPVAAGVAAGQAIYSPLVLKLYDAWVLGLSNSLLWRCPTKDLQALYDQNLSGDHLDIGVGTGYFLARARWPVTQPNVTLLDLNSASLTAAANRIDKYQPAKILANALEPFPLSGPFSSIGLCYLLHCLPGAITEKAVIFDHIQAVAADGARVFGATIVQGNAPRSWAAQKLMDLYNRKGIFSNSSDTVEDLKAELDARFVDVTVKLTGCVAIFSARARRI